MAAPRLPFLWPVFFRPSSLARPCPTIPREKALTRPHRACRSFASTPHRADDSPTQRYGTAHEPSAHLREKEPAKEVSKEAQTTPPASEKSTKQTQDAPSDPENTAEPPTATPTTTAKPPTRPDTPPPQPAPDPSKPGDPKPLDSVLHMPPPEAADSHKPPHLKTPPYVHHFDTYGLVRELNRSSAYTPAQSILIMKGVRQLLSDNMALARDGLVSKSNVENAAYLFRAAISELKTELQNSRNSETERLRSERAALQHEVDILSQRLGQESTALRDELKGLFDDRKMAVRQEQRSMESKIQELGYKITVALNSDARSEVEGLRWVLTRRAAITLGVSAFLLFVGLRYMSFVQHEEKKRVEREKAVGLPHRGSPLEELGDVVGERKSGGGGGAGGEDVLATEGVSLG